MSNEDFIRQYIKGKKARGAYCHLGFDGNELVNYSTVICIIDRENKTAKVNVKYYSSTTSRIQSTLRWQLKREGFAITDYVGEPCSYWNCGYMGAPNVTLDDMKYRR